MAGDGTLARKQSGQYFVVPETIVKFYVSFRVDKCGCDRSYQVLDLFDIAKCCDKVLWAGKQQCDNIKLNLVCLYYMEAVIVTIGWSSKDHFEAVAPIVTRPQSTFLYAVSDK